jgi:hypothetical protein
MFGVSDQPLAVLYTVDDLVDRYSLSKDRVYDLLKAGDLVGFKLGRAWMIHADDWNAYIDRQRSAAAGR